MLLNIVRENVLVHLDGFLLLLCLTLLLLLRYPPFGLKSVFLLLERSAAAMFHVVELVDLVEARALLAKSVSLAVKHDGQALQVLSAHSVA